MYSYINQWPKDREMGWSEEVNGVCHDENNWFFTQDGNLWRFPITHRIGDTCKSANPSKGIYKVSTSLHMGDIDHYMGYIFVPISDTSSIRIYRSNDLSFIKEQVIKREDGNKFGSIGWLAINPNSGLLYTSDKISSSVTSGSKSRIHIFKIGNIADTNPLSFYSTITLCDSNKQVLEREHMQGGCFDEDNHLHIVNGFVTHNKGTSDSWANCKGGISVFRVEPYPTKGSTQNVYRIDASNQSSGFRFQFNGTGEEPEGITFWNLTTDDRAPSISGHLHAIMIDNCGSNDDDFFFKHYRNVNTPIKGKGDIRLGSVRVNEPVEVTLTSYLTKMPAAHFNYQWQIGNPGSGYKNIWGATSKNYIPKAADQGYHIRLRLSSESAFGAIYSGESYVNQPSLKGSAELPGTIRCGEEVKLILNGEVASIPAKSMRLEWEAMGGSDTYWKNVGSGYTYTPKEEDVGKKIRVYVQSYDHTGYFYSNEVIVLAKRVRRQSEGRVGRGSGAILKPAISAKK